MVFTKRQADFHHVLIDNKIRTTFGGYHFADWTCIELRHLIKLLDPDTRIPSRHVKLDLCKLLCNLRPNGLSARESKAANAVWAGSEVKAATTLLVHKPPNIQLSALSVDDPAPLPSPSPTTDHSTQWCSTCYIDRPVKDFPQPILATSCQHQVSTVCSLCYTYHIVSHDAGRRLKVRCPESDCEAFLNTDQLSRYASREWFEAYEQHMTRRALEDNHEYFACIKKGCDSVGYVEDEAADYVKCIKCEVKMCKLCAADWHDGTTCKEHKAAMEKEAERLKTPQQRKDDAASRKVMAEKRPCPSCNIPLEKNGGCDHMGCKFLLTSFFKKRANDIRGTECGHEFSWKDGRPWKEVQRDWARQPKLGKYLKYSSESSEEL